MDKRRRSKALAIRFVCACVLCNGEGNSEPRSREPALWTRATPRSARRSALAGPVPRDLPSDKAAPPLPKAGEDPAAPPSSWQRAQDVPRNKSKRFLETLARVPRVSLGGLGGQALASAQGTPSAPRRIPSAAPQDKRQGVGYTDTNPLTSPLPTSNFKFLLKAEVTGPEQCQYSYSVG